MPIPIFQPYRPGLKETPEQKLKNLTNAYVEVTEFLQYILTHLDSDNVTKIDANVTNVENLDPAEIIDNTFITQNIVTNTIVTNTLYANYARIAQLTVDELSTAWEKITNYLISSTADVNYLYIHDQTIEFITASTDGLSTRQETKRDGTPLYWYDSTHTGVTDTANAYPVTTYVYNTELLKAHFTLELISSVYIPQLWLGVGTGVGDNGKSCIWKGTTGLYLDYYHSVTGALLRAKITDDGLDFGEIGNIIFDGDALLAGIVQWFVAENFPAGAKGNDGLIDINDPTVDDGNTITTGTTLTWASARQVNVTGTTIVTLPNPTTDKNIAGSAVDHDGVVMFCIRNANAANGMVTVTDGTLTKYLYPQDSITVRTGITTAWEVV
jgi:hypothetical protein